MKRLFKLVVVLAMIAGWPLALSALHVVHTPAGATVMSMPLPEWACWQAVTKDRLSFRETFVDTRPWTLNDIADHKETANRLDRAGLGSAFAHAGTPEEVAAALQGFKKDVPATPVAPAVPENVKQAVPAAPPSLSKPVEHVKPAPGPATQPTASEHKKTIFDF